MKDIKTLTAELTGEVIGLKNVPEFEIPTKYIPVIVRFFQPAESQSFPDGVQEIGSLQLVQNDGIRISLKLFWYGTSPAWFSINGKPYRRGGPYLAFDGKDAYLDESLTIYGALSEIHKESIENVRSKTLDQTILLLKKSAGS